MSHIKQVVMQATGTGGAEYVHAVSGMPMGEASQIVRKLVVIENSSIPDRFHIFKNAKSIHAHICYGQCSGETARFHPLYALEGHPYTTSFGSLWLACFASIFSETWVKNVDETLSAIFAKTWMKHMQTVKHGDHFAIMERAMYEHALNLSRFSIEEFKYTVQLGLKAQVARGIITSLQQEDAKIDEQHIETLSLWKAKLQHLKRNLDHG